MKLSAFLLSTAVATVAATSASAQGVDLAIELPVLNVFSNHGTGGAGTSWFTDQADATLAYRLIGTLDLGSDRGIRLRYFDFDADFANPNDIFEVSSLDLEAVFGNPFGANGLTMFAGLRAADVNYSDENGAAPFDFSGMGPTLGAEFSTDFGNSLSFFASGRYSALLGETVSSASGLTTSGIYSSSIDLQLGLGYERAFNNGSTLNITGGVETNSYFGLSVNPGGQIDPEEIDITAAGLFLRVGLDF